MSRAGSVFDSCEWQKALEAGINKAWGGNKPYGYSGTVDLVCLVARIFDEAGFAVRDADAESVAVNILCEECGRAPAYTLVCVDGTNMAVCRPCHVWLDHHSVSVLNGSEEGRTDG